MLEISWVGLKTVQRLYFTNIICLQKGSSQHIFCRSIYSRLFLNRPSHSNRSQGTPTLCPPDSSWDGSSGVKKNHSQVRFKHIVWILLFFILNLFCSWKQLSCPKGTETVIDFLVRKDTMVPSKHPVPDTDLFYCS